MFSALWDVLGVLPILSLLSIIIVGVTLFIGNFISSFVPKISADLFVKIIYLIINFSYVLISFFKGNKKKSFWVSVAFLVISFVLIFVSYRSLFLLLYYVPISLSALFLDEKLDSIRKEISKNGATLAFFNIFDIFYIILTYSLFKADLPNIIVLKKFELLFTIVFGVIMFLIIPLIREICAIYIYKRSNQISLGEGKVLWNTHIKNYLVSSIVCFLYFGLLISPTIKGLTVISIISVYVIPQLLIFSFGLNYLNKLIMGVKNVVMY